MKWGPPVMKGHRGALVGQNHVVVWDLPVKRDHQDALVEWGDQIGKA